jgi:hypothetical protein
MACFLDRFCQGFELSFWHGIPDLNPIELAFSKLKKLLRDGAQIS